MIRLSTSYLSWVVAVSGKPNIQRPNVLGCEKRATQSTRLFKKSSFGFGQQFLPTLGFALPALGANFKLGF